MKTYFRIKYFILLILLISPDTSSQELLIGLTSNGIIKDHFEDYSRGTRVKSKQIQDTLELPFFDDFSRYTIYPDPLLWEDQFAFVNFTYGVNPISIGVATLDAIDHKGSIYENANSLGFVADYLTSRPINLDYLPSDAVFLSFFYQPGGIGDEPSLSDSLVLEFYSPADSIWHSIWQTPGDTLQNFRQILVPVDDTIFLKPGFKFRFKNYASLVVNASSPGRIANCDHWNLDYIKLDKDRNPYDTLLNDVTMGKPIRSLLKNYEAMPWDHFKATSLSEMGNSISISYTNHDDSVRNVTRLFEITDVFQQELDYTLSGGAANIDPSETIHYDTTLIYTYSSAQADSALFEVKAYLITDNFDNKINDTVTYYQFFNDFFAYDDGSAEAGYGITGQGAENARIAYLFDSYIPDTLYGIQIYFNQSYQDESQKYFTLTVWADNSGIPGEILYSQETEQPEYEKELNKFHTYKLDTPVYVSGKFYVGWQQITDAFLNFGFDLNRARNNKIFYQESGTWYNSQFPGALMIRPVMGKSLITSRKSIPSEAEFNLFPNPADQYIRIEFPKEVHFESIHLYIFDSHGRTIFQSSEEVTEINLSGLVPGLYFMVIRDKDSVLTTKKFIISR
jgi:hypothetical protein